MQTSLIVKVTPQYLEFIHRFADSLGFPVSVVVDTALRAYAKQAGFEQPPMRTKPTGGKRRWN
jgi:hypothetical protein